MRRERWGGSILCAQMGAFSIDTNNRWTATYQIDRWDLTQGFLRTFPEHPQVAHKLRRDL